MFDWLIAPINLSGLFSPDLIDQSCKIGLTFPTCVVRMLHDDWSIRLGEKRPDQNYQPIKHLTAVPVCHDRL